MACKHRRYDPLAASKRIHRPQRGRRIQGLVLAFAVCAASCGETPAETQARLTRMITENQNEA
ncbi:MAG: hypothetical protein RIF32_14020, partial [Leptospirales bacterium]